MSVLWVEISLRLLIKTECANVKVRSFGGILFHYQMSAGCLQSASPRIHVLSPNLQDVLADWVSRAVSWSISSLLSSYVVSQSLGDNQAAGVWLDAIPLSAVWWLNEAEEEERVEQKAAKRGAVEVEGMTGSLLTAFLRLLGLNIRIRDTT